MNVNNELYTVYGWHMSYKCLINIIYSIDVIRFMNVSYFIDVVCVMYLINLTIIMSVVDVLQICQFDECTKEDDILCHECMPYTMGSPDYRVFKSLQPEGPHSEYGAYIWGAQTVICSLIFGPRGGHSECRA